MALIDECIEFALKNIGQHSFCFITVLYGRGWGRGYGGYGGFGGGRFGGFRGFGGFGRRGFGGFKRGYYG
jgi:hypothetical protein